MSNYNNGGFSDFTVLKSQPIAGGAVSRKYMANVFAWMFGALAVSTLFALLFANNSSLFQMLYSVNEMGILRPSGLGWIVSIAPIIFILTMGFAFNRLSTTALTAFFLLYAVVTGISLSYTLIVHITSSVVGCFGAASLMFGIMAVMGYTTDKDLTSFGRILTMGLIGIIISLVINMFLMSSAFSYIIGMIGVAVFTGLTAYDVQKLKRIGAGLEYEGTPANEVKKLALMGALTLYLDFLNLFIMLLSIFDNRKN